MKRLTPEQIQALRDAEVAAWGVERRPFEGNSPYFQRVSLYWKKRALAAEARLRDLEK